jgi:hypothetical protein
MSLRKRVLSSLMVALFVCAVIPSISYGDGPWDIDHSGGSETEGGTLVHDRTAAGSSAGTVQLGSETGNDGPSELTIVTYSWLYQWRLTDLAERVLLGDFGGKLHQVKPVKRTTRR